MMVGSQKWEKLRRQDIVNDNGWIHCHIKMIAFIYLDIHKGANI